MTETTAFTETTASSETTAFTEMTAPVMMAVRTAKTSPAPMATAVRTATTSPETPCGPALKRRAAPLLAAADGRQGHLSRPAALGRRGFPGLASSPSPTTIAPTPHCTLVPTPAHSAFRAIRVRRSPR